MGRAWFGYTYITTFGPDSYGWACTIAWFDPQTLRVKAREWAREAGEEEAAKLVAEIEEFYSGLAAHANLCGSYDCSVFRGRMNFEYNLKLLEKFGVPYKVEHCTGEPSDDDYDEPARVVEEAIVDVYPDLAELIYDP